MDTDVAGGLLAVVNLSQVAALAWISRRTAQVRQEILAVLEWVTDPANAPNAGREKPRP
jgi:hypothetical protein